VNAIDLPPFQMAVKAGIDVVSDGEYSKTSYTAYVKDRLTGFDGDPLQTSRATLDQEEFPDFSRQLGNQAGPQRRFIAATQPDRRPANALDEVEELPAGLFGDHLPEERAEKPDLERERIAGAAGPDPGRLGADRVVRPGR